MGENPYYQVGGWVGRCVGWVGGFLSGNIPTLWFHLKSWDLPDSQLRESKMEPSVFVVVVVFVLLWLLSLLIKKPTLKLGQNQVSNSLRYC